MLLDDVIAEETSKNVNRIKMNRECSRACMARTYRETSTDDDHCIAVFDIFINLTTRIVPKILTDCFKF